MSSCWCSSRLVQRLVPFQQVCLTKSEFNPGLSKGWKLFSHLLTTIRFQLPPRVDLLLIVLLFTAKFSLQSLFQGYYHVLFYAGGGGFDLTFTSSVCMSNGGGGNQCFFGFWPRLSPSPGGVLSASMLPVSLPLEAPEGPVTLFCWGPF